MIHVIWNSFTKDHSTETRTISSQSLVSKATSGSQITELTSSVHSTELYEDRYIWIPFYLDYHFWVGMRSTQRSGSMHAFFNKFITRNSSLRQFVKQYDNCLASRAQKEREFNAADFHTVIPCATKLAIEAHFQHVYTHENFREVQAQFREKVNCITRSMHSTLGFTTYEVVEQVSNSAFNTFLVTYMQYHERGILCRHSLCVLSFEQVDNVALKYILECWSKNINKRHTHIKSSQEVRDSTIWCFDRTIYANLHQSPMS
ncbi:hypothetical protein Ahy_A07g032179 [Arachis hypogaea]|uniref:Protein FAR1-RELATED SEQUENCE n=1 Tax=Arachis hypogaea TaxID=3818 RepID=A0A445C684_ARAHY|nr:hypothetical protein Ahy_A07g032179 [Arachis hypogaea]